MENNNNIYLFRVAQKAFKDKTMINIECNIKATKTNFSLDYYSYLEERIYFKLASPLKNGQSFTYDTKNELRVLMNLNDLRALVYGCKELYANKVTNYKNFTEPGLYDNTQTGKKILSLGYTNNVYFINIELNGRKEHFIFNKYSFLGFIDSIKLLCDEVEKILYSYQRKNDYKMKTSNSKQKKDLNDRK